MPLALYAAAAQMVWLLPRERRCAILESAGCRPGAPACGRVQTVDRHANLVAECCRAVGREQDTLAIFEEGDGFFVSLTRTAAAPPALTLPLQARG